MIFDARTESTHIIRLQGATGSTFNLLGVLFDGSLSMCDEGWKLRTLLRTRRYYNDRKLVVLYRADLLSFIENRTPASYHATRAVSERLTQCRRAFYTRLA